ncbi:MAG TPA: hypothetical protein VMG30_20255, partial [Acidobacteriota bacterium]|nr:hypothetical protein [Acidobacteriota bacterium]
AKDKKYQKDQDNYVCSNEDLVGEWGTTMTGTIFAATPVTIATVNRTTYESAGQYWGKQTRNLNGVASWFTFRGTYILNPDCTGTKETTGYDSNGNPTNLLKQDFVLIKGARELIEISTSNTLLPSSIIVPTLITGHSYKLFRECEDENER